MVVVAIVRTTITITQTQCPGRRTSSSHRHIGGVVNSGAIVMKCHCPLQTDDHAGFRRRFQDYSASARPFPAATITSAGSYETKPR